MTTPAVGPAVRGAAVPVLTAYVVLLLAVPSPMVVRALGQLGAPATLAAVGCFLLWCWAGATRSVPEPARPRWVRNAALMLLLVAMVAYAHSAALPLPLDERSPADAALVRTIGSVGLACLVADHLTTAEQLWTVLRRLVLVTGLVSLLALFQSLTGEILVNRLSIPGLTSAAGIQLIPRGAFIRPVGTATHPIEYSAVVAMVMPFAFAVAGRAVEHQRLYRGLAILLPLMLLMSGSRTAMVCGAVSFAVMLVGWAPRTRLVALGVALVMLVAMFATMPGAIGTLRGMFLGAATDPSVASRTNSYAVVLRYVEHHVWWGRGLGTFLPKYWIVDNEYLLFLLGAGVVGLLALLGLVVVGLGAAGWAARRTRDPDLRQLGIAAVAALLGGAVSLALFDAFSFPQANGVLFIVVGVCGALPAVARSGPIEGVDAAGLGQAGGTRKSSTGPVAALSTAAGSTSHGSSLRSEPGRVSCDA